MFPRSLSGGQGSERSLKLCGRNPPSARQNFAKFPAIAEQRGPARVSMLGFQPAEGFVAPLRTGISADRAAGGPAVNPVAPDNAQGNGGGEAESIDARARRHANRGVKTLQRQSSRRDGSGPREIASELPLAMHGGGPGERREAIKKNGVRERADEIPNQALPVAPEPIRMRQCFAERMKFPGLQRDARDPSRALADRLAKRARKIFARGDGAAVAQMNGDKFLRKPEVSDAESVFVVFGQADRLEDTVRVGGGERFERAAGEARAHAV